MKAPVDSNNYFVLLPNGKNQKHELYYGNGFLSQSGRYISQIDRITAAVAKQ